ncbi:MAG: DUF1499 domain-containing protein, partial [Rhodomicrobium sp.]
MRYRERHSLKASWSFRIALLSVLAVAGTFVWHRFFGLPTPMAMKVFYAAIVLAVIGLTFAAAALVNIWNEGSLGAGKACFAIFLSLLLLAVPAVSLPSLLNLPRLYEITTDPSNPPAFDRVAKIRQGQANPVHYEAAFGPLQAAAYPDIKPLTVARPLTDVYSAVRETVKALNWKVIDEQAPEQAKNGYIEAVDRTWIFGFTDDVAIRITGSKKAARIDIRSSSRFGQHDLGRNATRVRAFLAQVKERLAGLERAERMERLIASQEAAKPKPERRQG